MYLFWHQAPFVRMLIPLIIGIVTGYYSNTAYFPLSIFIAFPALLLLTIFVYRKKWSEIGSRFVFGVLTQILLFVLGFALISVKLGNRSFEKQFPAGVISQQAVVTNFPTQKPRSTMLSLTIVERQFEDGITQSCGISIIAYAAHALQSDTLRPGDIVSFRGQPQAVVRPLNPGQFDYRQYLLNRGITATIYLSADIKAIRGESPPFSLSIILQNWRERAIDLFRVRNMPSEELGVISALVLGKREMVDPELRTAFTDAGAIHILAVSGLHVGIIYLFASVVLAKLCPGKRNRYFRLSLVLSVLWLYAGITGFSPSVLRAATMFSFIALGKESGKHTYIYNMLGVSALLLLIINPFLLFDVGFQLSYLAVIGIVFIYPIIYPMIYVRNTWMDKIWSLLAVSLAAQIATFPLSLYYFHQFPNLFLISNLVVIPLATLLLYAGILFILLSWMPFVSDILWHGINFMAMILNKFVSVISEVPYAIASNLYISLAAVFLLYLLFLLFAGLFVNKSSQLLRPTLAVIVILVAMYAFREIDTRTSDSLAILAAPKGVVLVASTGKESVVIPLPNENLKSLQNHCNGYLLKKGVSAGHWVPTDSVIKLESIAYVDSWLLIRDLKVCLRADAAYQKPFKPDVLFLDTWDLASFEKQAWQLTDIEFLIAHPELKKWQKARLKEELGFLGISIYDVSEQGALKIL